MDQRWILVVKLLLAAWAVERAVFFFDRASTFSAAKEVATHRLEVMCNDPAKILAMGAAQDCHDYNVMVRQSPWKVALIETVAVFAAEDVARSLLSLTDRLSGIFLVVAVLFLGYAIMRYLDRKSKKKLGSLIPAQRSQIAKKSE
jgi:hypothetical protein